MRDDMSKKKFIQGAGITCGVVVAVCAIWFLQRSDADDLLDASRKPWFICTETGKPFRYAVEAGTKIPVPSPFSGKDTGMPAELCYWTKDGGFKEDPTPVLLNASVGKPGPTFCPDCGRLVIGNNPLPTEGAKPPPTQAEYAQRRTSKAGKSDGRR